MVSCANVGLFIWRRLLLQTLWRHYVTLAVELTFVVVTFVYLLSHDRVDPAQVKKLNRSYVIPQEPTAVDAEHIRNKLPPGLIVVYGPSTADTDRLIAQVFSAAGRESPTGQGEDTEPTPSDEEGAPQDYILPLKNASSVPAKCRAVASRLLRRDTYARTVDRTMCVQFYDPDNEQSLRYDLIELLPPQVMLPEGVLYSLEELFANPSITAGGDVLAKIAGRRRRVRPHLKEVQEVMGLSSNEFWAGHFFAALPISLVEGALAAAVLIFHEERYKPSRNVTVYKGDNLEVSLALSNSTTAAPQPPPKDQQQKFIRVYTHVPRVTRYLENADASLVAATFAIFALCHTLLSLLIACVFPFGRWAMVIGFAVYFMLPSVDGDKLGLIFGTSLFGYLTGSRNEKLRTAFYPSVALSNAMKIIGIFDDFESTMFYF
ncbi:hypothetical protein V5799_005991 [Amblyomma americanum]|uniref:Uncharacterized protein n=1 Tax=Amblyomma americanum TaxID=6943 RepID=A0AAQ4DXQ2_AMBAM